MRYLFVPIRGGFSVHAEGCAGIGRKARMATLAHNLAHDVEETRSRGHTVRFCRCTGIAEAHLEAHSTVRPLGLQVVTKVGT
jgi:hypothetical protein